MSNTPTPHTPGLTFEKVWAMFQETDKKFQETAREIKETSMEIQKTSMEVQRTSMEVQRTSMEVQRTSVEIKELKATFEKYAAERQEADKRLDEYLQKTISKMSQAIGDLGNRFGEVAEHLVAPGIVARLNERGYHFNVTFKRGIEISENGRTVTEVDILLENEKMVAVVEIKVKPTVHDVKRHLKRMDIVRRYYEQTQNTHKVFIGGIAGAVFPNTAKEAAIKAGFYVFSQSGDTITINVPSNFQPREF
ncbi:MAG: hypothetical protein LBI18_03490 [Planctomycetaceae bacterium]|jgi:hypothetical protein|nr:hypothetical protein [Planctomycetaceae bacterium]